MSASEAAQAFVGAWEQELPEFAIINFANADMVGNRWRDRGGGKGGGNR